MEIGKLTDLPGGARVSAVASRRWMLAMLTVVMAVSYIDRQVVAVLIEPTKHEFALTDRSLGLLSGVAFGVFYAACGLPLALLAERTNRRNVIVASLGVWSALTVVSGMAVSFSQLVMMRMGVAAGEAGSSPASHSIIADLYAPHERPGALGKLNAGINAGIMLGILLGGWLNHLYGWRVALTVVGLPGIALALVVAICMREPERHIVGEAAARPTIGGTIRYLLSVRTLRRAYASHVLVTLFSFGVIQWLPALMMRSYGMSSAQVGTTLALVLGAVGGLSAWLGGVLVARLLRRGAEWYRWLPAISTMIAAACLFFALHAQSRAGLYAGMATWALTQSLFVAPDHALIHHLIPGGYRALAIGILLLLVNLIGYALGPQIVGVLSDVLAPAWGRESLRQALMLFCFVALVPALIYWRAAAHVGPELDARA